MIFHDVSKESRLFRQLSYQASHDTLTGLINRREFENRLAMTLDTVRNNAEETHALLYIDLDQFKIVNDTCGHIAGDQLLKEIAALMPHSIRSIDCLARLGGDEFGILLERCTEERALEVATATRGADSPDAADTVHNLALLHHELGEYEEAKRLYEQGLDITRQSGRADGAAKS